MIKFESTINENGDVKIHRFEMDENDSVTSTQLVFDQPHQLIHGDAQAWADSMIAHLEEGEANFGLEAPEQPLPPEELEVTIIRDEPEPAV